MAKWDLERYFNQFPLHPDDQPVLGVRLPAEVLPDDLAGAGGNWCGQRVLLIRLCPVWRPELPMLGRCWARGVSATRSSIVREQGVPNVFPIDDFATVGRTKAQCQRNLDLAIKIFGLLGLKLNLPRSSAPASSWSSWVSSSTPSAAWCRWSRRR
jgi:hypothetical protein